MREILFKAKCIDTGKWLEGDLIQSTLGLCYIKEKTEDGTAPNRQVNLVTVGQYTGRKDKNGVMIFEGDMYVTERGNERVVYYSKDDAQFKARSKNKNTWGEYDSDHCMHNPAEFGVEVISSIHDKVKT